VEAKGATVRLRDGSDRGFMKTEALAEFLREQCAIPVVT
jgi:hypothetical protein